MNNQGRANCDVKLDEAEQEIATQTKQKLGRRGAKN